MAQLNANTNIFGTFTAESDASVIGKLHVKSTSIGTGYTIPTQSDDVIFESTSTGDVGLTILSPGQKNIYFVDSGGYNSRGAITYVNSVLAGYYPAMVFRANGGNNPGTMYLNGGGIGVGAIPDDQDNYAQITLRNTSTTYGGKITLGTVDSSEYAIIQNTNARLEIDADEVMFRDKTGATECMFMNSSNQDLHVNGDVVAYSTTISDVRLKEDIETIDSALEKVLSMRGVEYTWNAGARKGQKDIGVIAQEVEQAVPEIVREKEMSLIDKQKYKTVDYEKLSALLIEAIKDLKAEINELKGS